MKLLNLWFVIKLSFKVNRNKDNSIGNSTNLTPMSVNIYWIALMSLAYIQLLVKYKILDKLYLKSFLWLGVDSIT